jgi:hypothetical protein
LSSVAELLVLKDGADPLWLLRDPAHVADDRSLPLLQIGLSALQVWLDSERASSFFAHAALADFPSHKGIFLHADAPRHSRCTCHVLRGTSPGDDGLA